MSSGGVQQPESVFNVICGTQTPQQDAPAQALERPAPRGQVAPSVGKDVEKPAVP